MKKFKLKWQWVTKGKNKSTNASHEWLTLGINFCGWTWIISMLYWNKKKWKKQIQTECSMLTLIKYEKSQSCIYLGKIMKWSTAMPICILSMEIYIYTLYMYIHTYIHIYVCVFMELKLEIVKRQVLTLPQRLQATEKHHREDPTYHIYIR